MEGIEEMEISHESGEKEELQKKDVSLTGPICQTTSDQTEDTSEDKKAEINTGGNVQSVANVLESEQVQNLPCGVFPDSLVNHQLQKEDIATNGEQTSQRVLVEPEVNVYLQPNVEHIEEVPTNASLEMAEDVHVPSGGIDANSEQPVDETETVKTQALKQMKDNPSNNDTQVSLEQTQLTLSEPVETSTVHENIPCMFAKDLVPLKERFEASMVLAGVGDALGYKNGSYEFCQSGEVINEDVTIKFGGVANIMVDPHNWMVSDDTVMHIATAEALIKSKLKKPDKQLYLTMADDYVKCMGDMSGRAAGNTCLASTKKLQEKLKYKRYDVPFNPRGGGCGAAMRAAPIGLLFNHPDRLDDLIAVSVESGRMTHNHPTGYLGALATALFVAYAIQQKPLAEWGRGLLECLPLAKKYVQQSERDVALNMSHWEYFQDQWIKYLEERQIMDGQSPAKFPQYYGPQERDSFYRSISFSGWGGSSGHDAPMIAYDALLGCRNSWEELCKRSMFHGGDSDSTGIIAAACWGAMNGYEGVPHGHYEQLEYRKRLATLGNKLHDKFSKCSLK